MKDVMKIFRVVELHLSAFLTSWWVRGEQSASHPSYWTAKGGVTGMDWTGAWVKPSTLWTGGHWALEQVQKWLWRDRFPSVPGMTSNCSISCSYFHDSSSYTSSCWFTVNPAVARHLSWALLYTKHLFNGSTLKTSSYILLWRLWNFTAVLLWLYCWF